VNVRTTYLTIRCPVGCEAWLHPRASVDAHIERCRRHPWVDDIADTAVVPAQYSRLVLAAMPADLIGRVDPPGETRAVLGDGRTKTQAPTPAGLATIASPIPGVPARDWIDTAIATIRAHGPEAIERALDPDEYARLRHELGARSRTASCKYCGHFFTPQTLALHQANNAVCAWRRAATEVRTAWVNGWRDPYSIPGTPIRWVDLQTARWRRQLRTVLFPRWIAVLLPTTTTHGEAAAAA
jgi:hypothetical protein